MGALDQRSSRSPPPEIDDKQALIDGEKTRGLAAACAIKTAGLEAV